VESDIAAADRRYILTLGCPDETGIVARIAGFLADAGAWITEAAYHSDADSNWFFTRQAVRADSVAGSIDELRARFATMAADQFHPNTEWRLTDSGTPKRVVVLVSRESHCLIDLLGRAERGEFPGEIAAVIGNHVSLGELTERFGVPFHLVPFDDPQVSRSAAFDRVAAIVDAHEPAELDAGPIIEQDVIRVDHSDHVADMVRQGRDIETMVLARGVRWHLEDRVLVHGGKTVVFD